MANSLEKDIKKFVEDVGYGTCKRAGLGPTMAAFYAGMTPDPSYGGEWDEVVNELGIPMREANYWEDIWYKKDSWFNQMG